MRLTCLMLMGLTLLAVSCRTTKLRHLLNEHPYDTLNIYSYLVITLQPALADSHVMKASRCGTAFFYRKGDELFLVTAFHVLSGCPFYDTSRTPVRLDSMDVWYRDSLGRTKAQRLSLAAHKLSICPLAPERGDVDTINVSPYFKDTHLNTVEGFVCDRCGLQSHLICKEIVVAHGFSNVDTTLKIYDSTIVPRKPDGYISLGRHVPRRDWCRYMPILYSYIEPHLREGASGAPVFRIRPEGGIDFMGVQSGKSKYGDWSTVAKWEELKKLLSYK